MSELEPYLARSIKLLLSNEEDSCEQLRAMLEESIRNKYGSRKAQAVANLAVDNVPIKRRILNSYPDEVPFKRIKSGDGSKSSSSSPALTFETESSGGDSEDLTLEILEENLCLICRGVATSPRNRIVECMDCHNLYHQNCASPPIEADVNDPRFVWYCNNCSKGTSKVSSPSLSLSSRASFSGATTSSATTSSSSGSNNVSSKSSSSKSSSSGSSSRSNSSNTTYAMSSKSFGGKFRLFKSAKR